MGALCIATLPLLGSTITSGNVSSTQGTVGLYSVSTYSTTEAAMIGMVVQVTWYGVGGSEQCTWTATGCSVANGFSVSEADGGAGTYNGTWSFTNSNSGNYVNSITFLGSGVNNPTGTTVFNMCWNGSSASTSNSGCVANSGTTNSNLGWTASSVGGGNSASPSSVVYSNEIHATSLATIYGDEFSQVAFTFPNYNTSGYFASGGSAFTWRMDTDTVASSVPEPATYGLVGFVLAGLGAMRFRKQKRKS